VIYLRYKSIAPEKNNIKAMPLKTNLRIKSNPMIDSYNASAVKSLNTTNGLGLFQRIFFSTLQSKSRKYRSRRFGT
jgi:hypothetical protein